jgi:hypothetical protein
VRLLLLLSPQPPIWFQVAFLALVPVLGTLFIVWWLRHTRARALNHAAASPHDCLSCNACGKPFRPQDGFCPHCWQLNRRGSWFAVAIIIIVIVWVIREAVDVGR